MDRRTPVRDLSNVQDRDSQESYDIVRESWGREILVRKWAVLTVIATAIVPNAIASMPENLVAEAIGRTRSF